MRIYEYKNYQDYVDAQTKANEIKENWIYVRESTIKLIKELKPHAENILCHGTRNGAEQKFFLKAYPQASVIGTEISHTASKYPMTVQHDFSKMKSEWIGKFDIVYSNAFDHSICPDETLLVWSNQLSPYGKLFLEYSQRQSVGSRADPLDATEKEVEEMITKVGLVMIKKHKDGKMKNGGVLYECQNVIVG